MLCSREQRFLNGDDDFRNGRFKYACRIVKAPWLLQKAVSNLGGERPTIIGRKLTTVSCWLSLPPLLWTVAPWSFVLGTCGCDGDARCAE